MEQTTGYTINPTQGVYCGEITRFDIPAGTRVINNARDCDGEIFPHWVLPVDVATELSQNEHDSKHRFIIIDESNVRPPISRKQFLDREFTFREYYGEVIEAARFKFPMSDELKAACREEIEGGNVHLNESCVNSINKSLMRLDAWDARASMGGMWGGIQRTLRERGDYLTLAGRVCIVKEAVRRQIEAENA